MKDQQLAEIPIVQRVASGVAEALKNSSKLLDAATFEPVCALARLAGQERQLRFEAAAPLRKLIELDEIAFGAQRSSQRFERR